MGAPNVGGAAEAVAPNEKFPKAAVNIIGGKHYNITSTLMLYSINYV